MKKWGKIVKKFIVALGISSLILSSGCASSSKQSAELSSESQSVTSEMNEIAMDQVTEGKAEAPQMNVSGEEVKVNTKSPYNRKIIKTGNMDIQTEQFSKTIDELTECVMSLGGYIENSSIQGTSFYNKGSNNRTATLRIRIPEAQFDHFVNRGNEFGNVSYLACNSEDITNAYVDTEMRLKTLKVQYERLLSLLEKSGTLKELFEIEQEMSQVTYEIENLKGTLNQYDALVDMSTLTIQVQEVKEIRQGQGLSFGQEIQQVFKDSIRELITMSKNIVLCLVAIVPFVILLIPVLWIGIRLYQRKNKKNSSLKNREEKKED